jgi:nitrilase
MPNVAVAQVGSRLFDTPGTLERLRDFVAQAHAQGVEFIVFPEAFVGGYPTGLDFGTRVGIRTDEGREEFRRYYDSAIDVPGPAVDEIAALAAQTKMFIVVGVVERDQGSLYCTALYFSTEGILVGKHRKVMPTGGERLIWGQGDGSTLEVFDSPAGRFAAAICWENYMPQLRLALYEQGIQLWCAPTVSDRDVWQASMRHIAYEGRMFVLSATQYLTRADAPDDYAASQGSDPSTVLIRGGSVIVSPAGDVLAGPVYGKNALLVASIDLNDIPRAKYDLDVVGHYARPDIFRLNVDTSARKAVQLRSGSAAGNVLKNFPDAF